jgi:hypothetical protein
MPSLFTIRFATDAGVAYANTTKEYRVPTRRRTKPIAASADLKPGRLSRAMSNPKRLTFDARDGEAMKALCLAPCVLYAMRYAVFDRTVLVAQGRGWVF